MAVQSPDFYPRWALGSLPEDPAEFQRILAGRLHALEGWVKAAHARINFTQPFILPTNSTGTASGYSGTSLLASALNPAAAGIQDIGIQLSFTSAIRAQALVLLTLDVAATAAGTIQGRISVNGAADMAGGPLVMLDSTDERIVTTAPYSIQLAAATPYVIKGRVNVLSGTWIVNTQTRIALIGVPLSYTLP